MIPHAVRKTAYQPIENYGIIGDLNTIALVGINGSIDFMCLPDFDSPTVFAALLDKKKGGFFLIHPQHTSVRYKQLYLSDTNVLLTRFLVSKGVGEVTDFMPVQELYQGKQLARRVTTVQGTVRYEMRCSPRFDYAQSVHAIKKINTRELVFYEKKKKTVKLRLKSTVPLAVDGKDACASFTLEAGEKADFLLIWEDTEAHKGDIGTFISQSLYNTIKYWKVWIDRSGYSGRWAAIIRRSALVLKLLISEQHGSMVAAPTFGLPEEIGGVRNWDYRYAWIRDSSFTVYALIRLGYLKEAGRFINWVEEKCMDIGKKKDLQLMYTLSGGRGVPETSLDDFEGYRKSRPVRIGNAAFQQVQLDIYGELMDAVYLYDKFSQPISFALWEKLSRQIDWVCRNWQREDEGIWEVRGGKKPFLYSRLMCWVAIDRGIKIGNRHSYPEPPHWRSERDTLFYSIHKDFWNERMQSFVQYKGATTVDAATLLMPIVSFISPVDPRWLSTLACIEKRLVSDALIYRYRNHHHLDGLKGGEGTFSMCSFWYVECLALSGQIEKARLVFEKILAYANHLGLYAEQLGINGQHLGNFPQAFTHLGLISAALCLNDQLNDERNKRQ